VDHPKTEGITRAPPDLFHFMSMEEHQVLVSLANMKEELPVLRQLEELYSAALSAKVVREDEFVIFQLLTFSNYHFLFMMACQLRCHLSEAFASARAAIDAALIAAHIINDRASQVAYAKREKPFDNFARYLGNLIKDGKPLPHPLIPVLIKQQKTISTFAAHADVGSFVHRLKRTTGNDGQRMLAVEYFQFSRSEEERKIHTFSLLHTFVMVLDVFADFLETEQRAVPAQWKEQLHQLGGRIEDRVRQLQDAVRKAVPGAASAPSENAGEPPAS
jgi:hypothetical protein